MKKSARNLGRFKPVFRVAAVLTLGSAALLMVAAVFGGLARMGVVIGPPPEVLVHYHGPLMVSAFFGAVISMERAVALRRTFGFIAPITSVLGGIALVLAPASPAPPLLFTVAGFSLVAVFAHLLTRRFESFTFAMALGAVCFAVANLSWSLGLQLANVVPWWASFLVLTIAGERLELSRFRASSASHAPFWAAFAFALIALAGSLIFFDFGLRLLGLAFTALAIWLLKNDVARATIRIAGAPRFMAFALFTGYAWLLIAGLLLMIHGALTFGPIYDAVWHALFVGFVFSMIFAHAQVIIPALSGVRITHGRRFYLPLIVLHLSMLLRLIGDLSALDDIRRLGGIGNALAIALFIIVLASSIRRRKKRPH